MRNFTIQLTQKTSNGQIINVDPIKLSKKDQIKFEMIAIDLFDQIVENDDCREAKQFIKHIQHL
jgi:hypothetical protein